MAGDVHPPVSGSGPRVWIAVLFSFEIPGATGHFLNQQKYPAVLGYSDIGNDLKFL